MNDQNELLMSGLPVADAVIQKKTNVSIVWLIPVTALLIGLFLLIKTVVEQGPVIEITFKNADGLQEGITQIKYKDVSVGKVKKIIVSKDLETVIITAQLKKWAESYINENTKFWLVKARISAGEISGLKTLISGVYIGIDPGKKGKRTLKFEGLEKTPAITSRLPGKQFKLKAGSLGSLDIGSAVFYKKIEVGTVTNYELRNNFQEIDIDIFIQSPYDKLVTPATRFWNDSGINLVIDSNGVKINSESITSILIGGIAFDNPEKRKNPAKPLPATDFFTLYNNKEDYYQIIYTQKIVSLVYFDTSVKGLNTGATVEFRGIPVGKVLDIRLEFDMDKKEFRIPVIIETEPERISVTGNTNHAQNHLEVYKLLVRKGLRAQLRNGNILTGQLYVDLDLYKDAPPAEMIIESGYPVIPTLPTPFEQITTSITKFFKQIDKLPLKDIGKELHETVVEAKQLFSAPELKASVVSLNEILKQTQEITEQLNQNIAPELSGMIKNVRSSVEGVEKLLASDSLMVTEMSQALQELTRAARSVRELADYLEKHPESLFYGKGKQK
jgi:paraquat-inducible protein B